MYLLQAKYQSLFSSHKSKYIHSDKQKHDAMKIQHTAPSSSEFMMRCDVSKREFQ